MSSLPVVMTSSLLSTFPSPTEAAAASCTSSVIEALHIATTAHGVGDAMGDLANAAQQPRAIFLAESAHSALQFSGFGDDVKGGTCADGANGNDGGTEWGGLAADERLQRRDDVCRDDDGIDRAVRHGSVATLAFHVQHEFVGAGKDGTGTHANAADRIVADEVQADHAIDDLHGSFFYHGLGPTDDLFGGLEDKFHAAGQL